MSPSGTLQPEHDSAALKERIRAFCADRGLARVGFTDATRLAQASDRLEQWLARGYGGELDYLRGDPRGDPEALLAGARSIVVVALPLGRAARPSREPRSDALCGAVARYAQGLDYHDVLRAKLRALVAALPELAGTPVSARACVDTAPLLERDVAARAGLGFVAKSTLLIVPGLGTEVLLGAVITDLELPPDAALPPRCGACRLCLDACPTGAFVGEHLLDARRCISYLTIELVGPIPIELRSLMGTRVFGCDACQDVCPFNSGSAPRPGAPELQPLPRLVLPELVALLELGSARYRTLVKKTALRRVTRAQLARNAAVALGNTGARSAVAPLSRALVENPSPIVRGHAAWALGRLGGAEAARALTAARATETDLSALREIDLALSAPARAG